MTVCAGVNVAVEPSGKVTVASPLSATDTSVPGFTALTASVTAVFSASVNASVFLTGTGLAGALTPFASAALTVCAGVNVAVEPFE